MIVINVSILLGLASLIMIALKILQLANKTIVNRAVKDSEVNSAIAELNKDLRNAIADLNKAVALLGNCDTGTGYRLSQIENFLAKTTDFEIRHMG